MLADQSESDQVAVIYAIDARLKAKKRKQRENKKSKKKMKGLEPDAKILTGPEKTPDDRDSTHANIMALPGTSEVDRQKNDGAININSSRLIIEVESGDCSKLVEEYKNGERNNKCVGPIGGTNGHNYVYRTKAEEYKMIAELGMCPQLSAMVSPEARMKNAKTNENKGLKMRQQLTNAPATNEGLKSNNFSSNSVCGPKAEESTMLADQSESDQLAAMYAIDARMREKKRKNRENKKSKKKMQDLEPDAKILTGADITPEDKGSTHVNIVALPDTSEAHGGVRFDGGINRDNYVYRTKEEEYKMIAELGISPQLSAMVASEEARIKKSAISSEKKGLEKTQQLTNAPTDVIQSSEVQKKNCIEGRVEVISGDRVIPDIGVYKCRTKAEEYRMLADLNNSPQAATVVAFEATMMNNTERSKNTRTEDNQISAEPDRTPKAKDSSYFNIVALPDTSKINPQKNEGIDNINSTKLSEAQNGDCSEVVEEDKTGGRNKKCVISDGSINRDNYVYRTKAQEYKMIAELGISPQLSAMVASEDKMKKSAKRIEKKVLEKTQQLTNSPTGVSQSSEVQNKTCIEGVVEVTNGEAVKPVIGVYKYRTKAEEYRMLADLSNCSQDAAMFACEATMMDNRKTSNNKGTEENHNSAVACMADEQGGNIHKALGSIEEINTNDGLRSAIVIDPGLSFSEGHEETVCLGNTRGIPEVEKTEAPVREEEKMFDRRDGVIAVKIVKHGDSTKAAETTPSLKSGSLKKEDNFMLQKLLRKPRYFDFPNSSLQMCHICGEHDHKAAECTMEKRKKPCYICGGFRHTAKHCKQGRECFKCRGTGHLARNCLEEPLSNKISDFCLKCGDSGHNMFICQSDYSSEDLKKVQCYICKEFGHLCCDGFKYEGQTVVSCYKCGQNGHLGSDCIKQESRTRYSRAKGLYNHEVKGHFAGKNGEYNKDCIKQESRTRYSRAKGLYNHEVKGHFAGKNGEYNKAGQCAHESTTVDRSFSEKEIIPNFVYAPLKSDQGVPSNQGQRCGGLLR